MVQRNLPRATILADTDIWWFSLSNLKHCHLFLSGWLDLVVTLLVQASDEFLSFAPLFFRVLLFSAWVHLDLSFWLIFVSSEEGQHVLKVGNKYWVVLLQLYSSLRWTMFHPKCFGVYPIWNGSHYLVWIIALFLEAYIACLCWLNDGRLTDGPDRSGACAKYLVENL